MRYEVIEGHPMCGRCRIRAIDGGRIRGMYDGWYDVRKRQWRLYPILRQSTMRRMRKLILDERDVTVPRREAESPREHDPRPEQLTIK